MLVSIALDGRRLEAHEYRLSETALTLVAPPARRFVLDIETKLDPTANTKLSGLYRSGGAYCTQCEAQGFRRITYFPDRPDVSRSIRRGSRPSTMKLRCCSRTATRSSRERSRGAPAISRSGTTLGRSRPIFLRWSAEGLAACLAVSRQARAVRSSSASTSSRARRHAPPMRFDALKRSMRWDERGLRARIRSRRLQHRRRVGFQHGRDGEQGPQHLQRQICAGEH